MLVDPESIYLKIGLLNPLCDNLLLTVKLERLMKEKL